MQTTQKQMIGSRTRHSQPCRPTRGTLAVLCLLPVVPHLVKFLHCVMGLRYIETKAPQSSHAVLPTWLVTSSIHPIRLLVDGWVPSRVQAPLSQFPELVALAFHRLAPEFVEYLLPTL